MTLRGGPGPSPAHRFLRFDAPAPHLLGLELHPTKSRRQPAGWRRHPFLKDPHALQEHRG